MHYQENAISIVTQSFTDIPKSRVYSSMSYKYYHFLDVSWGETRREALS